MSKLALLISLSGFLSIVRSDFIVLSLHPDSSCAKEPIHYFLFEYGNDFCSQWKDNLDNSLLYGKMVVTSGSASEVQVTATKYDDASCSTNPQTEVVTFTLTGCESVPNGWSASFNYFVERPMLPADKSFIIEGGYETAAGCTDSSYNKLLVAAAWAVDGCYPIAGGKSGKFSASGNSVYHYTYSLPDCAGTETLESTIPSGTCYIDILPFAYPSTSYERTNLNKSLFLQSAAKGGKDTKAGKDAKGGDKGKSKAPTPGVVSKAPTKDAKGGKDSKGKQ